MTQAVLHNLRILDFSWVLAGPYATRIMADFGAEVIKIQPLLPEEQDKFSRGYYQTWNRNKLGITLNLNKPEGITLAKRLVGISDVVVENFTPRVMANWGLDYPELKKIKPDIILLSMSLIGQTGPLKDYVGFGLTAHAFSAMTSLTSYPGQSPSGPGFSYADHIAGLYACLALLSALEHHRKTGEGQHVDISEAEAMAALLGESFINYELGSQESGAAPQGVYRCKGIDRWCAISVRTEEEWQTFKQVLDNPVWSEDKKFATLKTRLKNAAELNNLVESWTIKHDAEEVMYLLQTNGIAAGVVQDAADLMHDRQLAARGFFFKLGENMTDASPIKLSATPASYVRPAPEKGQDNDYVFRELLRLSGEEINRLRQDEVI